MRHPTGRSAAAAAAAAAIVAASLVTAGCGTAPARPVGGGRPARGSGEIVGVAARVPAVSARQLAAADTQFGLDLLSAWCRAEPQGNIVFSPSSLASGLGMAYLGARGATEQAMARVLHLPPPARRLLAELRSRTAALRGLDSPGVTVTGSDRAWIDPALVRATRHSYLNAVATGYRAGVWRAPLLTRPVLAARQIDAAIGAATRGHIPRLVSAGQLRGVGWVLTDALYLNARWARPFQASMTGPGQFRTAAGRSVTARYLNGGGYRYTTLGGWTGVALPYRGGKLTMLALLPAAGAAGGTGTATAGCPSLTAAQLGAIEARLAPGPAGSPGPAGPAGPAASASIALPRISLSTKAQLNGLLSRLGMGIAFTPAADFTGLSGQACCIGFVEHAATLTVAEKGTVASAATAVGVLPSSLEVAGPPVIRFDRPYLLVIADTVTGEPLFLARVANPLAG